MALRPGICLPMKLLHPSTATPNHEHVLRKDTPILLASLEDKFFAFS